MINAGLSVNPKRLNLVKCLFILCFCMLFCGYVPAENENTRFGTPGGKGKKLVKTGFTAMYSGVKKNPVWVSYLLKKENIVSGSVKPGSFKSDKSLEPYEKTAKEDYPSKFDKCPMAPVLDMAYNPKLYSESFLLSNICPMNPSLKRLKWRELEDWVRKLSQKYGDVWVVSGPVFDYKDKKTATIGRAKIALPTGFFKVMLYQSKDYSFNSIGFYMDNSNQQKPLKEYMTSVDDIERRTGFDFFNLLPAEVQRIMKSNKAVTND